MKLNVFLFLIIFSAKSYSQGFRIIPMFSIKGGTGQINLSSNSKDYDVYGGDLFLGLSSANIVLGLSASQLIWNQQSHSLNENDFSGIQRNYGIQIGVISSKLGMFLDYFIDSSFERKLEDENNFQNTYFDPTAMSYSLKLLYNLSFGGHIGIEYSSVNYQKINNKSTNSSLSDNNGLKLSSLLLVIGNNF